MLTRMKKDSCNNKEVKTKLDDQSEFDEGAAVGLVSVMLLVGEGPFFILIVGENSFSVLIFLL